MAIRVMLLFLVFALTGCGVSAKVSGTVTCQGRPVVGSILFSPKGEGPENTGPAVPAQIKADGSYEVTLKTIGEHTVVITPADVKYPVPEGEFDYPCDRTPSLHQIQAGENKIMIGLKAR